jgi:hypothetical protein
MNVDHRYVLRLIVLERRSKCRHRASPLDFEDRRAAHHQHFVVQAWTLETREAKLHSAEDNWEERTGPRLYSNSTPVLACARSRALRRSPTQYARLKLQPKRWPSSTAHFSLPRDMLRSTSIVSQKPPKETQNRTQRFAANGRKFDKSRRRPKSRCYWRIRASFGDKLATHHSD